MDYEQTIKVHREQIDSLTTENHLHHTKQKEHEGLIKANKMEIDKQNANLKTVFQQKTALQVELQTALSKSDKEINSRNTKITDLVENKLADQKQIKKLQETNERQMFQITDLENNFSTANASVKQLNFEFKQHRRDTEEKVAGLEGQIDKLNGLKQNLTKDKLQLVDRLNAIRTELKKKEDELDETQANFQTHRQASSISISSLDNTISELKQELKSVGGQYTDLTSSHHDLQQAYSTKCKLYDEKCVIELDLSSAATQLRRELSVMKVEIDRLEGNLSISINLQLETKHKLEICLAENQKLDKTLTAMKEDAGISRKLHESEHASITNYLEMTTVENRELKDTIVKLSDKMDSLSKELFETKELYRQETELRVLYQDQLHENRIKFLQERTLRSEFERLNRKIMRDNTGTFEDDGIQLQKRNQKLQQLEITMKQEAKRLNEILAILPKQMGNNIIIPDGKEFEWLIKSDEPFKSLATSRHPHGAHNLHTTGESLRPSSTEKSSEPIPPPHVRNSVVSTNTRDEASSSKVAGARVSFSLNSKFKTLK